MDLTTSGPAEPFSDQRTGLMIFGAVQIIAGIGAFAVAALMLLVLTTQISQAPGSIVPALVVYPTLGTIAITLGIGSILCRRWARDLTLVASCVALVFGVFLTAMLALIMPRISSTVPSAGDALPQAVIWISIAVVATFWVGVPSVYAWFYGREATRLTCQARDPKSRWTEAIPLPLLGGALVLGVSGFWSLSSFFNPVFPIGPMILSGVPAAVVIGSIGLVMMMIAAGLLRRSRTAWLALMAFLILGVLTGAWTFASFDVEAFYAAMTEQYRTDVPPELFDIYTSPTIAAAMAVAWAAWLAFAFSLRRYVGGEAVPR